MPRRRATGSLLLAERHRGEVRHRARELELHEHLGHVVLQRLERPIGTPNAGAAWRSRPSLRASGSSARGLRRRAHPSRDRAPRSSAAARRRVDRPGRPVRRARRRSGRSRDVVAVFGRIAFFALTSARRRDGEQRIPSAVRAETISVFCGRRVEHATFVPLRRIAVAVASRASSRARGIVARVRLFVGDRDPSSPSTNGSSVVPAGRAQDRAGQARPAKRTARRQAAAELFHQQQRLERAAEAAQFLRRADREPAQLGELRPLVGPGMLARGEPRDAVLDQELSGESVKSRLLCVPKASGCAWR